MWACRPTSSTPGINSSAATASVAAPEETENPNFESSCPGADEFVGVGLDPGRHPDEHARAFRRGRPDSRRPPRRATSSNESTTMRPTPVLERRGELVGGLVVAVQDEPIGGDAGGEGDVKLAA